MATRREAPAPGKSLRLPHVRATDYRLVSVDGTLHKVEGEFAVVTFFQNDTLITSEAMTLKEAGEGFATYVTTSVNESHQRTDVVAVRIPVAELIGMLETIRQKTRDIG